MLVDRSDCIRILSSPRSLLARSIGLAAIFAACLSSIAYLSYFLPEYSAKGSLRGNLPIPLGDHAAASRVHFRWPKGPRRLIVFGDSWSDNGQYPIDPPSDDRFLLREAARGQVWTERLCAVMSCDHHDNFARPLMSSSASEYHGAVVDNSLLNSTWMSQPRASHTSVIQPSHIEEPTADLRAQIQHWLAFEKEQYGSSRSTEAERIGTVFSIWFSLWDIWWYSGGVYANAQVAITKSLATLFDQLDLIADNWPSELRIVLLKAIDVTFLPGWQRIRTGPYGLDSNSEDQRNAALLVEQWNQALDKRASRWDKGQIYIYNTHDWFLDQIRGLQLQKENLTDANGLGSKPSPWLNVRSGCLGVDENSRVIQDTGIWNTCSDPSTFLFWDDFHLGPAAMKSIGDDLAADIGEDSE